MKEAFTARLDALLELRIRADSGDRPASLELTGD
jgi:hypothetical protein